MCNLSLVEFDDKPPLELLELLNRLLGQLDNLHLAIDIQKETQDKTQERICGFLKVLGYPSDYSPNFMRDVVHGDKRTVQHILHWIITRLQELQRKAYTAKFLVPLAIPDEYLVDDDMRETFQIYKDLQAEFQATHLNVEQIRGESMNPGDLKKEIQQLEQEKEQLLTKINLFKTKSNKEDFQALLESTSKLRKEQEQDAKLNEKERELNNMIEFFESQLLTVKQRFFDIKKMYSDNVTPDKMLENLRTETRRNRELCYDILGRELQDKQDRLQRIELVLQEPMTTQSELERLTNDVKRLQRECQLLDDKIRQNAPADDKLAIYKSQATAVSKKKEQKMEEVKKLDTEKIALEKLMNDKESEYAKTRGGKYMKRDDFKQYAANLRGKNAQYKQMKKVITEIKSEVTVLSRTESILKSRADNLDEFMRDLEKQRGISGIQNVQANLVQVSENNQLLNNKKEETLQEITVVVTQIENEVKEKKQKLAPEIKKLRGFRQKFSDLEAIYNEKKKQYDAVVQNLDQEKNKLEDEVKTLFEDYKQEETRFHHNNIQNEIYDAFLKRIGNEAKFLNTPDKRLSNEFKSYSDFFNAKLRQQENIMKDLKSHQRHIKDNSENYSLQVRLFKDLKSLLEIKRRSVQQGHGDGLVGYQDRKAVGFDRFVVND
eukprot:403374126